MGRNQEVVTLLKKQPQPEQGLIYLWGERGVGKSHMLQAVSQHAVAQGFKVFYLNLQQAHLAEAAAWCGKTPMSPAVLDDLDNFDMICIDDVDGIAGEIAWEIALFSLYNMMQDKGNTLIITAAGPPKASGVTLPDLISRLTQGYTFHIKPLNDNEIKSAILEQMQQYGFNGDTDIINYIANRTQRDISALAQHFAKLDQASLVEQRALTIPFIKKILGW